MLTDPAVVVQCIRGATIVEELDDGTLVGALRVQLGPTVVTFKGNVTPSFNDEERHGSLVAQGADGQGRTRARATTNFGVTQSEGSGALVTITGQIEVSGPLAPFVRTGGAHLARQMVADFSRDLSSHLENTANEQPHAPSAGPSPTTSAIRVPLLKLVISTVLDIARGGMAWVRAFVRRGLRRRGRP
jgi:carbon monoxide dehydrogenase subunit G